MKREASDKDIADRFADVHGHRLRYDFTRACWYLWDGCLWGRDETERARALLRDLLVAEYSDGRAKKLTSAHSLAIIHDRLAVTNATGFENSSCHGFRAKSARWLASYSVTSAAFRCRGNVPRTHSA